ncbi:MAG TPA: ferredoxin [Thermohalobaculum sp.]|nr:ferredoxin [Thermohalobaculum sp.]
MTEQMVDNAAAADGLAVVGAFHAQSGDRAPEGVRTICLLGARGGEMWRVFSASPEAADGQPDALDRWSQRVIERLAAGLGAVALFPFGGPPYQPFQAWAARGEAAVPSPVAMQVTPGRGLWTSYRGALGLRETIALEERRGTNPCLGCPAPCLSACPVDAFAGGTYDVPRCVGHITSPAGAVCRDGGCLVRQACPAGHEAIPPAEQCRFHMEAFIRARLAVGARLAEEDRAAG